MELGMSFPNRMGNDQFVDFPPGCWLLALGIHATPPTLLFPSGYTRHMMQKFVVFRDSPSSIKTLASSLSLSLSIYTRKKEGI